MKLDWDIDNPNSVAHSKPVGYRVTWSRSGKRPYWFNAYCDLVDPPKHIAGSHDRNEVKRKCEEHADKFLTERTAAESIPTT